MSAQIVLPANFNASKVTVSEPKTLDSGGKMAYLNYDNSALIFQTPSLPVPFGLNIFDKTTPAKYSINLALRGYQDVAKVKAFYDGLKALDDHMVGLAVKNRKLWFKDDDVDQKIAKKMFEPNVKFSKDKEGNVRPYPPNVKLNFKKKRGTDDWDCDFNDVSGKPLVGIPLEEMLPKKVEVTCLMQCTSVYFAGGKFGCTWKAVRVRLDKIPTTLGDLAFAADGDDDDGAPSIPAPKFAEPAELVAPAADKVAAKKAALLAAAAESSDEEEEEEAPPAPKAAAPKAAVTESDSEEEVEAPPVPVKRPVVTKKKVVAAAATKK